MDKQVMQRIKIELCYALPNASPVLIPLLVESGTKPQQILAYLSGLQLVDVQSLLENHSVWAIFGKKKNADYCLLEGDRLELCRPLIADPMSARRLRAKREHKSGKM